MKKILFIFVLTLFAVAGVSAQTAEKSAIITIPPDFQSDGCTWFPEGNYRDCCEAHDREYFAGGSWTQRWRSDKKLFLCVAAKPKFYNKLIAPIVWLGVRVGGVPWLNTRFSWGFGKRKKPADKISKKKKRNC